MYRRNLAAFWTAQPGELRADECIEDIFAGGDGWGRLGGTQKASPVANGGAQSDHSMTGTGSHGRDDLSKDRQGVPPSSFSRNSRTSHEAPPHARHHSGFNDFASRHWHRRGTPSQGGSTTTIKGGLAREQEPKGHSHVKSSSINSIDSAIEDAGYVGDHHHNRDVGIRPGSLEEQAQELKADDVRNARSSRAKHEVDEFDLREDLRSWRIPEASMDR